VVKGQTSTSAAVLVIIITLVLVMYIVSMPPEDRIGILELPSSGTSGSIISGGSTTSAATQFSFVGPGEVNDVSSGKEYRLPTVTLRTRTNSEIFHEDAAFYIYSTARENKPKVMAFSLRNDKDIDNTHISFVVKKHIGILSIIINNQVIYENEITSANIPPIRIPSNILRDSNLIEVRVSEVGWAFWRKNEYIIESFKVFGDVTESSQQTSYSTFEMRASEQQLLNRVTLEFYPNCDQRNVGPLYATVNKVQIFAQNPDCQVLNIVEVPISVLRTGINSVEFNTKTDSYILDRILVKTSLKENTDLIYYFELSDKLFNKKINTEAICGEVDGICPINCPATLDKDCCFQEYVNAYWCVIPTANVNDRCVGRVDSFNAARCPSGYEDKFGRPHDSFKGACGDDTDNFCPAGCSAFYDKDCCLASGSNNFWCSDLPTNGVTGICVGSLTIDQARMCPKGYIGESSNPPAVTPNSGSQLNEEITLNSKYKAEIELRFIDDGSRKQGRIRINDQLTTFSTYDGVYTRDISRFIKDGNNYVQILPDNTFRLVNTKVQVKER
jgi:hypothetical protein